MNRIGLDQKKTEDLVKNLNDLLSNYQVFYMNVRGFHWNIKGDKFFELHQKFEDLYTDLIEKIDEIAERVLTLGANPDHSYSKYLEKSKIKEVTNLNDGDQIISSLLDSYELLIKKQRKILSISSDADDEGTSALMSDYLREQEKLVWMLNAYKS